MRKIFLIFALICFVSCFGGILLNAQALDVNSLFTTLKSELGNKVVADNGINAAEQPIKKMLGMGVGLNEIKSVLLDFIGKGFKGNNLGSLISSVSDLMKNKDAFKSAASFVSQAIQQVSATGLKGDGLVAKVQEIVGQKKSALGLLDKKGLGSLFGK